MYLQNFFQSLYQIYRIAVNEAAQSNLPGQVNGPGDTYRHLIWGAEMTRRYGETIARIILEGHERQGAIEGQPTEQREMDTWNNEKAIELG